MTTADPPSSPLTLAHVARLWWPLALSWIFMSLELPLFTTVVARMPDPKIHLAAYGSLVFPISLVIEGPIIMLLAASTALCRDLASYRSVWRCMMWAGGILTAVHVLVAFTPLYDVVARDWIGVPEAIVEPGRIGLRIMTPWTWAIAYRRFQQGVLIRNDRSRDVGVGTFVRLGTNALVLWLGWLWGGASGIVVGATATAIAVTAEAVFVAWRVRPIVRERLAARDPGHPIPLGEFLRFYLPLAVTPLITLIIQPIGSKAMSQMPETLDSLAAWPAVHGLVFLLRSTGFAFNEVVVSLSGRPHAVPVLRTFTWRLAFATSGLLALLAATPLGMVWFGAISDLPPRTAELSHVAIAFAVLMPGYQVLQSRFQGTLVHHRSSRAITEAVVVYLVVAASLLRVFAAFDPLPGVYAAVLSFTSAGVLQTTWLWWRARRFLGGSAAPSPAIS